MRECENILLLSSSLNDMSYFTYRKVLAVAKWSRSPVCGFTLFVSDFRMVFHT